MNIDLGSFAFGSTLEYGAGTPSWGTALGQSFPEYKITYPGSETMLIGMVYCSVPLKYVSLPIGKGGSRYTASSREECQIASLFRKVYINDTKINYPFVMVLFKEESDSHPGRKAIKYSDKNDYNDGSEHYSNQEFINAARTSLGIQEGACWFVYKMEVHNQDELHLYAVIVDKDNSVVYENSSERKRAWLQLIPEDVVYTESGIKTTQDHPLRKYFNDSPNKDKFLPYLTALRTKPFMLLAGISGTGKSRIVRELAKACWKEGDEEYGKNCPKNFCMVQVKPNWHDSTELFGYVSRISGKPEFVAGDFMKFVIKAWENPDVPYFLCLDEMNLAPVEQYFAEYLSVIESRKSDGVIISTDPIFKKPFENIEYEDAINYEEGMDWYQKFIIDNTSKRELRQQFYKNGITIPNNLFIIGTVNMDETTFSFSRKVLDRAMTLEMNEVDLYGGLEENGSEIGYIGNCIIGNAAEGKDIYAENKELCDNVISYLEKVNAILDKTPFKVAYRTRNEFILYAVNRQLLDDKSQLWQTLDEMTSMKVLSRIEGDGDRTQKVLEGLKTLVDSEIVANIPEAEDNKEKAKSITAAKIEEMLKKLKESSYTSYWA